MKRTQNYKNGKTEGVRAAKTHGLEWAKTYLAAKRKFMDREGKTPSNTAEYWSGFAEGVKSVESLNRTRKGKLWADLEAQTLNLYQSTTWTHYKPNLKRSSLYLSRVTRVLRALANANKGK